MPFMNAISASDKDFSAVTGASVEGSVPTVDTAPLSSEQAAKAIIAAAEIMIFLFMVMLLIFK